MSHFIARYFISLESESPWSPICRTVEVGEDALAATSVSETMRAECERDTEREKILELIADIGTGSEHMIAACSDQFQPWFWETSPHKVMTV